MYPPDEEQPTELLRPVPAQAPVAPQAPLSSQQGTEVIANAGQSWAVGDDAAGTQVLGAQPQFTAGPGQPLPPAEPKSNRNVVAIVAGAVLLVVAIAVGALLLMGGGDSQQASGDAASTTAPSGSGSTGSGEDVGAGDPTGDTAVDESPGGATTAAGGGSGSGSSSGGSSTSTKPVFVTASLPSSYDCKAKSTFTVSWKTQNVTKVDVSVDGGYFGSYGPNDSVGIPANCNDTQAVKITAHGKDGSTVSKSVTAKDTSTAKDPKAPKDPSGSNGSTDDPSTKSMPDSPGSP